MPTSNKPVIKLYGNTYQETIETDNVVFTHNVEYSSADAFLAWGSPSADNLLNIGFSKIKAWYLTEPSWHSMYRTHPGNKLLKSLKPWEVLWHNHKESLYRIPHPTHISLPDRIPEGNRCESAVALVSNYGGRLWPFKRNFCFRNRFVTHRNVDLYGPKDNWKRYYGLGILNAGILPKNYAGEGVKSEGWNYLKPIEFLARYHAVVCLENCSDKYYFTEKFVNAAAAGCVPIYHAVEWVRENMLNDAKWIDPADFGYNPEKTVKAALAADRSEYESVNSKWLKTPKVLSTSEYQIFVTIGNYFLSRLGV